MERVPADRSIRSYRRLIAYGLAVALPVATLYIRECLAVSFGERPLLILFVLPIVVISLLGGLGPGLLSTAVAAGLAAYHLMPPIGSFAIEAPHDVLQWSLLILNGALVSALSEVLHRSRQREHARLMQLESIENALRQHEATYRSLFENILNSVVHARVIFEGETPVDMEYLATNPAFAEVTGIRESVVGRRINEVIPGYSEHNPESIRIFGQVAATGVPMRWEHYLRDLERWFAFMIYSPAPGEVVIVTENITERKRAEEALRDSESRFRSLVEGAPEAVYVQCGGVYQYVNKAMLDLMGATHVSDLLGKSSFDRIAPEFLELVVERNRIQYETGMAAPLTEIENLRLDGSRVPTETIAVPIRFNNQDGHLVFLRDITSRKKAEKEQASLQAQLRHAQKMESVGRLAGGVAHDFNNLLAGILNYTDLCRDKLTPDHPARPWLDEIAADVQRSAAITRQLLAFARKQTIAPVALDLNDHVAGTLKMLRRLIGEDIDLAWLPKARSATVRMDPSQIDQILANLAVNARDAIEGVGRITVESGNAIVDADYCAEHADVAPGAYVLLTVSDTGCGMDKATLEHLFEPFFTTKTLGKGTGLGLATVYGIVNQNRGFVNVYSEPGKGTAFRIYLPQCDEAVAVPASAPVKAPVAAKRPGGRETILLVEDEPSIRVTARAILAAMGYTVLAAESPDAALKLVDGHAGGIDLMITDVVMPGMSGRELADRLLQSRPGMRCIFMSGYTADIIAQRGVLDAGVEFLQKPFSRDDLAQKVRAVLDKKPGT